jgi:hypothetical protein
MAVWGGMGYVGSKLDTGGLYAYGHYSDDDGDGLTECDGDCDDSTAQCWANCSDDDADAFCADSDCDASNPDTHPGAAEVNDGEDNQCPGDLGYGVVDETSGNSGFHNPDDRNEYSWPPQQGATLYEVARSTFVDFSADCMSFVTSGTVWIDEELPGESVVFHYLNRPVAPNVGSWGQTSAPAERVVPCP